ncbi:MAG: hypothetical protein U0638_08750 [Phycisphaerales bacterium]
MNAMRVLGMIGGLLGASASVRASIVSVSGAVQQIAPPSVVIQGFSNTNTPDTATAWDEKQGVFLPSVPVDMINHGGNSNAAIAGTLTGVYDSHYIHYRHWSGNLITGSVTFSGKIVGAEFTAITLLSSDATVAPSGTTYIPANPRGIFSPSEWFTTSGSTIQFHVWGATWYADTAEIRVITEHVPAPSAGALATLAGLIALRRRRR